LSEQSKVEHLFRHEYGKLVAMLLRRFGITHIDAIEDAVQWSLAQALEFWPKTNPPSNPSGWLYRVAFRHLVSEIRSDTRQSELLSNQIIEQTSLIDEQKDIPLSGEMNDSLLRILFVACDKAIPVESQLVFTLKSLCGFNIREVSIRLFITEANAYKRFNRARQYLKQQSLSLDTLSDSKLAGRLPAIHRILYLVFTEGYLSSHPDNAIRQDLCEEAIRLMLILIESSVGDTPESNSLLALMYLHLARINTRQSDDGALLLLEQQDRNQWDKQLIALGLSYLQQSTNSETISRYHIEAGIAAEHCLSASFEQTRWDKVVSSYKLLEQIAPSPMHLLNRAVALAEWQGPQAGLSALQSADIPKWLDCSYHWYAVQSDLHFRCDENALGQKYAALAIDAAPTESIKQLLANRLVEKR
jgi:RNA polymerase sigma-70 factor (ECF subfamily)